MHNELEAIYQSRIDILEKLKVRLERETIRALEGVGNVDRVSFRVKSPVSFANKALDPNNDPPYEDPFYEIEDQVAGRIIVFFLEGLEEVQDRLKGTYNTVEFERRKPPADEEFGYESNHLICLIPPQVLDDEWEKRNDLPPTFEIQIRTVFMHAYAEPQHDFGYKSLDELPRKIRRELAWVAASSWGADQAYMRIWEWYKSKQGENDP